MKLASWALLQIMRFKRRINFSIDLHWGKGAKQTNQVYLCYFQANFPVLSLFPFTPKTSLQKILSNIVVVTDYPHLSLNTF